MVEPKILNHLLWQKQRGQHWPILRPELDASIPSLRKIGFIITPQAFSTDACMQMLDKISLAMKLKRTDVEIIILEDARQRLKLPPLCIVFAPSTEEIFSSDSTEFYCIDDLIDLLKEPARKIAAWQILQKISQSLQERQT